jgi:hypothetical protein
MKSDIPLLHQLSFTHKYLENSNTKQKQWNAGLEDKS